MNHEPFTKDKIEAMTLNKKGDIRDGAIGSGAWIREFESALKGFVGEIDKINGCYDFTYREELIDDAKGSWFPVFFNDEKSISTEKVEENNAEKICKCGKEKGECEHGKSKLAMDIYKEVNP